MSIIFYAIGGVVRALLFIVSLPLLTLNALLDLPGLSFVWGCWVWFCHLFGGAGSLLLESSRSFLAIGLAYVPFWVVRWLTLRKQPLVAAAAAPAKH